MIDCIDLVAQLLPPQKSEDDKKNFHSDELVELSEHTFLLVISSFLMLMVAVTTCYHGLYHLGAAECISATVSINYWRYPTYGWRRTVDFAVQNMMFIWLAFFFTSQNLLKWFDVILVGVCLSLFIIAIILWRLRYRCWIFFHFGFHMLCCMIYLKLLSIMNRRLDLELIGSQDGENPHEFQKYVNSNFLSF